MKVLDSMNDLENTLKAFSNRKIQIITAFASGTEELISTMLANKNSVEIIIGTINSFSSPKLIEYCQNQQGEKIRTYVDFRYEDSVHWKLYLIEPNIVIIGSANFTLTGVSLKRDTMTVVKDESLYDEYILKIDKLKNNPRVIYVGNDKKFNRYFSEYQVKHKRMQKALANASQHKKPVDWLNDEVNQTLPLFIWESQHSTQTIQKAHNLIEESGIEVTREDIKDFSTYECGENEFHYEEGDVVLTANHKGSHIAFQSFDRIIFDDGIHYIYSFKKKRYKYPFKLDELKRELKKVIPDWYENGVTEIHRNEISSLLHKC